MRELVVESREAADGIRIPVRFAIPGTPYEEVQAVLDSWPGEDHHYFRVRVRRGCEYILRHDLAAGSWRIDFFRRDADHGGRGYRVP